MPCRYFGTVANRITDCIRIETLMTLTRRRSWLIAVIASLVGTVFFYYDDLLDESHIASGIHVMVEMAEFVLLGPGLGVLVFVFCEYLRITQDKLRSERERAQQQRFLLLGRIAASVAHEVRNPLHNIRLLIDEMHHTGGMSADQPLCQRVEANLERINRAVELVYQLAKPVGSGVAHDVGVDLVAVAVESADAEASRSGTAITRVLPSTPALVACFAPTLRIVLDNLLRNALASGAAVSLEVAAHGDGWQAVIRNRGELPPELLGEGGDEPHESTKQGGLGLGLFISRQLLRGAGGSLLLKQNGDHVEAYVLLPRWTEQT
jgi:signal transduction histidine kinase